MKHNSIKIIYTSVIVSTIVHSFYKFHQTLKLLYRDKVFNFINNLFLKNTFKLNSSVKEFVNIR